MTARPDAGRLLEQRIFDVAPDETAFSLNAKCYAAGLESFADLARRVAAGDTGGREQDLVGRSYFGRHDRPAAAAVIDWQAAADEIAALVRALDFGPHPNPLALPKVLLGDGFVFVGRAEVTDGPSGLPPGTVAAVLPDGLQVATRTADILLGELREPDGAAVTVAEAARRHGLVPGKTLPPLTAAMAARLTELSAGAARSEAAWRATLSSLAFPDLDLPAAAGDGRSALAGRALEPALLERLPRAGRVDALVAAIAVLAARRSGTSSFDIAYGDDRLSSHVEGTHGAFPSALPLRVTLDRAAPFARGGVGRLDGARGAPAARPPRRRSLGPGPRAPRGRSSAVASGRRPCRSASAWSRPRDGSASRWLADGSDCRLLGDSRRGGSRRPARGGDRRRLRRAGATSRRDRSRHPGGAGSAPGDLERHGPPRPRGLHPRALLRAGAGSRRTPPPSSSAAAG